MKSLISKSVILCVSCLFLQCSTSHSRDVAGNGEKPSSTQEASQSLAIDPEWRIRVIPASTNIKEQWDASCTTQSDCWYWTSSKLFVSEQKTLREIQVRLHPDEYILDASPVSQEMGWVVTTAGLFQISNSGANRVHIAVPDFNAPKGRIHAVHFEDDKRGWIAGGVYRSLADHDIAPNNALSDDRRHVLVGALARTRDGGLNWETTRFEKAIGRFNRIAFSQQLGLVSGDAGLQSTADGGETWKDVLSSLSRRNLLDRPQVIATFVLHERHGWASISGSNLLMTEDGAKTWKMIEPSGDSVEHVPTLATVAFVDNRRGLALQNQVGRRQIYKTNDGGQTWSGLELKTGLSGLVLVPGSMEIISVGEGALYSFTPN